MSGWVLLAFYGGFYLGGVAALWTLGRVNGTPMRWRAALAWGAAFGEQVDRLGRDGKA